jgi:hypothetical protein
MAWRSWRYPLQIIWQAESIPKTLLASAIKRAFQTLEPELFTTGVGPRVRRAVRSPSGRLPFSTRLKRIPMFEHASIRWAAQSVAILLVPLAASLQAQTTHSWSAAKAAKAAAAASQPASGDPATLETVNNQQAITPASTQAPAPIIIVLPPGAALPADWKNLVSPQPLPTGVVPASAAAAGDNSNTDGPSQGQPQSRLQTQKPSATPPARVAAPSAPLRPQSDPARAGERSSARFPAEAVMPNSMAHASASDGSGGIFKWPAGMRIEYAEPQPVLESPMAKRSKALFRKSKDVPVAGPPASTNGRSKALFANSEKTAASMPAAAELSQAQGVPSTSTNAQAMTQPSAPVPAIQNGQSRALFAKRSDGRSLDEVVVDLFQASDTSSKALFAQRSSEPSGPLPTIADPAAPPAPQTAAGAADQNTSPSNTRRSKALFTKPLWGKPAEPDPLQKYLPTEYAGDAPAADQSVPQAAIAAAQPSSPSPAAQSAPVGKPRSKALFPKSMFVRSRTVAPPPVPEIAARTPNVPTPAVVAHSSGSPLPAPKLLSQAAPVAPDRPAASPRQLIRTEVAGTVKNDLAAPPSSDSSADDEVAATPWGPSKRRPKAARKARPAGSMATVPTPESGEPDSDSAKRDESHETHADAIPMAASPATVEPSDFEPAVVVAVVDKAADAETAERPGDADVNFAGFRQGTRPRGEQVTPAGDQTAKSRPPLAEDQPAPLSSRGAQVKRRPVVIDENTGKPFPVAGDDATDSRSGASQVDSIAVSATGSAADAKLDRVPPRSGRITISSSRTRSGNPLR